MMYTNLTGGWQIVTEEYGERKSYVYDQDSWCKESGSFADCVQFAAAYGHYRMN